MLAYFFRNIECDKPRGTISLWSKRSFDNYSGSYKVISVTSSRLLKTQISEKKRNLSSEKTFLAQISRFIQHEIPQGTSQKGLQCILTYIVEVIRSFL